MMTDHRMLSTTRTSSSLKLSLLLILLLLLITNVTSQNDKFIRKVRTNTQCSKATVVPSLITRQNPYVDNTTTFSPRTTTTTTTTTIDTNPPDITCPESSYLEYNRTSDQILSAWYQWTPSISGYYDFQVLLLNVYSWWFSIIKGGPSCTQMTQPIGCRASSVSTSAPRGVYLTANTTYFVTVFTIDTAVSSFGGDSNFDFMISPTMNRLQNDDCKNALPIASTVALPYSTTIEGVVAKATIQPNEIQPSCDLDITPDSYTSTDGLQFKSMFGGHSMWYTFSPPITGYYKFTTYKMFENNVPITMAVYEATIIGGFSNNNRVCSNTTKYLREVHCTRDNYRVDRISELKVGILYYIQLVPDMYEFDLLDINIELTIDHTPPPPVNDLCTGAIVIDPKLGIKRALIDARFASSEMLSYPNGFDCASRAKLSSRGVWYKYIHTGGIREMLHNLCSSRSIMPYYMFSGDNCTNDHSLECVDEFIGTTTCSDYVTTFTTEQPTTYWFLLNFYDFSNSTTFTVTFNQRNHFRWIDASNDTVITNSISNATYSYGDDDQTLYLNYRRRLYSSQLSIDAYYQPKFKVQSTRITFTNPNLTRCDNSVPFSTFGDTNGNYRPMAIPIGNHTVTAVAYTQPGCRGPLVRGGTISNAFTIKECPVYHFFATVFDSYVASLLNTPSSLPCNAILSARVLCYFTQPNVKIELYDAITNTSIVGDTVQYKNYDYYSYHFGRRNQTTKLGVSPINIPPSSNYVVTVTIDSIRHSSQVFSIAKTCTP